MLTSTPFMPNLDPLAAGPQCASAPLSVRVKSTIRAYLALSKARLCALVIMTSATGYLLALAEPLRWSHLLWAMLGCGLAALGVNALNQCMEVERDRRMRRTRARPLPAGQLSLPHAAAFGMLLSAAGPLVLLATCNPLSAFLTVLCQGVYLLWYTPMKLRSPLNTLVGAISGALPPMVGWAAASGRLEAGAWAIGAILFFWQIPHFLALAWVYRDDYARGGFRMLSVSDPGGTRTADAALLYALALIPVSLALSLTGATGWAYAVAALFIGLLMLLAAVAFRWTPGVPGARRLFVASIIYLPLLLIAMLLDAQPARSHSAAAPPASAQRIAAAAQP